MVSVVISEGGLSVNFGVGALATYRTYRGGFFRFTFEMPAGERMGIIAYAREP